MKKNKSLKYIKTALIKRVARETVDTKYIIYTRTVAAAGCRFERQKFHIKNASLAPWLSGWQKEEEKVAAAAEAKYKSCRSAGLKTRMSNTLTWYSRDDHRMSGFVATARAARRY